MNRMICFLLNFLSHLPQESASFHCQQHPFKKPYLSEPYDMKRCLEGMAAGPFSVISKIISPMERSHYILRRCTHPLYWVFGFVCWAINIILCWWKKVNLRGWLRMGRVNISVVIDTFQKYHRYSPTKSVIDMKSPNLILSLKFNHFFLH